MRGHQRGLRHRERPPRAGSAPPLQRAALEALADEGLACAYGCPNPLSEPIVKRVGFENVGELKRFVKVLRTRLLVDQFVDHPRLARMLSASLACHAWIR